MKKLVIAFLLVFIVADAYTQRKQAEGNKIIDNVWQPIKLAKEDTTKVNLLIASSTKYLFSAADSSLIYSKQALKLAQKINYPAGIALSEGFISVAFAVLGNYPQAVDYGLKSLEFSKNLNDPKALIASYLALGLCYNDQGNYKKSLDYLYLAFKVTRSKNIDRSVQNFTYGNLANVYTAKEQPDSALYFIRKMGADTGTNTGVLYDLGRIYFQRNDHELALRYFRKTLAVADTSNVKVDGIYACNGMARLYFAEGKMDSAIHCSMLALSPKWSKIYPKGVLVATNMLANIYEKKGVTDSALKYLRLTIGLNENLYSAQKVREIENIDFNNKIEQQQREQQQNRARNRLILISLAGVVFTLLIIGLMQWRSNKHKQKAYLLLKIQKQETDIQKEKVEKTLEELKTTQNQLVQSAKMASLGELTAGIAHEIQNPLNFVNNFSDVNQEILEDLKAENTKPKAERDEQLELDLINDLIDNEQKINRHGKRADAIVKGMLQHTRASSGQKEATDMNALADEYLHLAYHGLRAKDRGFNAEISSHFDENLPLVNVVPQDMGRVLLNLFNNAFYALNQKAKTVGSDYKPTITVSTGKENRSVIVKVGDNGNGIPDAIKDKIMQPFFTTKPTAEGTGLGLWLTYDIVVKGHGGSIVVDSKEGVGSEFIIILPMNGEMS